MESAQANVAAAEAALRQAHAHELLTQRRCAHRGLDPRTRCRTPQALAEQAEVELGYAQVFAPVTGKVNVRAARQGEVVAAGATIVTVMDLTPDLGLRAAAGDPGRLPCSWATACAW